MAATDTAQENQAASMFSASLAEADPEIASVVAKELGRQRDEIELIASENIVSKAVLEAQGSVLTNKYAEGRPGRRYYVVAHGSLEITRASRPVATLGRGEGIGEISLLAGLPCTATATAGEAGLLYALDAEPFIEVMNDAVTRPAGFEPAASRSGGERSIH